MSQHRTAWLAVALILLLGRGSEPPDEISGTANPLDASVSMPPIPPQTGPDLTLEFAIVP